MNLGGLAILVLSLVVSTELAAQGITVPRGVREAYFVFWGLAGIVPSVLLLLAFTLRRKRGTDWLSVALTIPAVAYAPTAIALAFFPSTDLASKLPAAVGFGTLFGVVAFFFKDMPRLRWSLLGTLGTALAALLAIPNSYWQVPFLAFERVVYDDNIAPQTAVRALRSRSVPRNWIALEDGRHLVQHESSMLRRDSAGRPVYPSGEFVALEPADRREPGRWFNVSHYDYSYRYGSSLISPQPRYVIPLSTRSEDMYRKGPTSLAVLLNEDADVDYEKMLGELLRSRNGGWSIEPDSGDLANKSHWARVLSELGATPAAADSRGNSMLHVAAASGDFRSAEWLLAHDADPDATNDDGQTALDIARQKLEAEPFSRQIEMLVALLEERAGRRGSDQ